MGRVLFKKGRLFYLLILLVSLIFLYPLVRRSEFFSYFLNIVFTFILIAILYGVRPKKRVLIIDLAIGVPWLILHWIVLFNENESLQSASFLLMTLLFGYVIGVLLKHISEAEEVTPDLLFGAGSIYLLLGFAWSGLFMFLETLRPGSFYMIGSEGHMPVQSNADLVYYSFTTLTTLGYGDIVPRVIGARSLAILEAITGVLFMSILIGTLVGIFVAHSQRRPRD
jgi:hypothetical protein